MAEVKVQWMMMKVVFLHRLRKSQAGLGIQGRRKRTTPTGIAAVMKSSIDIYNDRKTPTNDGKSVGEKNDKESEVVLMKNLSLDELYRMIQEHKFHMEFLKDNDIMTGDIKLKIVENIEYIFQIIEGRSSESNKKRNHDDIVSSGSSSRKLSN